MTKPLVLTRIRQVVSAGKCVAGMISPPRPHIVLFQSYLRQLAWPILEHPCDSWWDVPKIQTLAAQRRTAWALAD